MPVSIQWALGLCAGLAGGLLGGTVALAEAPGYAGVGVFEVPALVEAEALVRLNPGAPGAHQTAMDWTTAYPDAANLQVTAALTALAAGDDAAAISHLLGANDLGAQGLRALLTAPALARIAGDPRLADLQDHPAAEISPPPPALVEDRRAPVTPANSTWDPGTARVVSRFIFPPILRTYAFADGTPQGPLAELQRLVARGFAAGNAGDLYDNRDDGHSILRRGKRTQLSHVAYGPEARAAGLHYGLNTRILFDAPTFGNSSTALSGPNWRSQPRFALTSPGGAIRLSQLYTNNHVYIFPEDRDHDPAASGGQGDLLPALTPYVLISQGSSGSDQPLLQAVQAVLAAFPPEVKARLTTEKLIAPMVQRIIRQGLTGDHGYMDPAAHPTVIRAEDIDLAAMIRAAQAMTPQTIPPAPNLRVLRETAPHASIFADGVTETLFNTPAAVARAWRGGPVRRDYELEVRAEDPNGRDLTFHWRVLRGDPASIRIEPQDEDGRRIRLALTWQPPRPAPRQPGITVPRVDIAVFADNGAEISAPAIFSMLYPAYQARDYDAEGRLLSIKYRPADGVYADPLIWPARDWEDSFLHDGEKQMIGWTRRRGRPGQEAVTRFTAHGLKVIETGPDGRAALAQRVTYPVSRTETGALFATETAAKQYFRYDYANAQDRIGRPIPTTAPAATD
ncbi:MAG: hypothetical protein AAFR17_18990 [Pseudomonadota bacterium]